MLSTTRSRGGRGRGGGGASHAQAAGLGAARRGAPAFAIVALTVLFTTVCAAAARAGRLQLPGEFVSALDLRDRVRLALEPDHVGVWPDLAQPGAAEAIRPAADPEPGDGTAAGRSS